jgi:hypothetical protein
MNDHDNLAVPDPAADYLELAALFSSVVPVLGGAIQQVLGGQAADRRFQRLSDVLRGVRDDLQALGAKVREEYIASEEFADLLDQTLRRAAAERHEQKRRVLRAFLVDAMTAPVRYDEQLRILRTLDELQVAHVKVIRAAMQDRDAKMFRKVMRPVLHKRFPEMSAEDLDDLIQELEDLKIVKAPLDTTMPGQRGYIDAQVTPYGERVIRYIMQASEQ